MAKTKHLRKAAEKFRKTEPAMHTLCSQAISYMAYLVKKTGAAEVTVVVKNGVIVDGYANE